MHLTKRLTLVLLLVFLAGTAFAQWEVKINVDPSYNEGSYSGAIGTIKTRLEGELNDLLDNVPPVPENMVQGFADASIFASHGATQRAYGGYDFLAITAGFMLGLRLPGGFSLDDFDNPENMLNSIAEDPFGVGIQGINVEAGLHISKFLPINRLYAAVRFGYINANLNYEDSGIDFNTFQIGVLGRYQLVNDINLFIVKWRGITVGTGFMYQRTGFGFDVPLGLGEIEAGSGSTALRMSDPAAHFGMTMSTYTIPLEINTAVQLLFIFNIGIGAGVDLAFGSNDLDIGIDSKIYRVEDGAYFGYASIEGGGTMSPNFLHPKLMASFGFKFGPVIIDIPMTYYIGQDHGLSLGVTVGAVF